MMSPISSNAALAQTELHPKAAVAPASAQAAAGPKDSVNIKPAAHAVAQAAGDADHDGDGR